MYEKERDVRSQIKNKYCSIKNMHIMIQHKKNPLFHDKCADANKIFYGRQCLTSWQELSHGISFKINNI